ncbi:MAG: DNA mismatch repair protein MutS [Eubacterium aggregans]|uniref:DNA mismatch repair protein MutS n=2 Tax=Eubacterium aggregans TaxID=81409 RepID=UPI002B208A12|nr:DNA mismatch repair protein MutS [Eubacterium aggregans]MEA5074332.1 DNA mismatch repair protein MutS [Eubacterium aggregans]
MGLTPMMQQYLSTHEKVPDAILMFRLGDFYEMFFDDALTASRELEIALTGRDCGLEERAPMCGVPYHAAENYIARLVEKGHKVAICEQMEDPATAKGIVHRDIIRVVSPGTISDTAHLAAKQNNFLMALCLDGGSLGLSYLDISTGECFVTELSGRDLIPRGMDEIAKVGPAEILMNPALYKAEGVVKTLEARSGAMVSLYPAAAFNEKNATKRLLDQFKVYSLLSLGLEDHHSALRATGALLGYVEETQKQVLGHINHLNCYKPDEFMVLDTATRRNLELTETLRSGEKRGSLLWVLDQTVTAMGGRLLRRWVEAPLLSLPAIQDRQQRIAEFIQNPGALPEIKKILSKVYDLERICGKIAFGSVSPKDMLSLGQSIEALGQLGECFATMDAPQWKELFTQGDLLEDIHTLIDAAINPDAPLVIKDGNVIKTGYHPEIDSYREAGDKGKDWIRDLEIKEREATGIKSLKVKYNRIFGYFIEVTKTNLDQVPETYIRKQTLANAERYFTPELKEMETRILGAEEKLAQLEYQVFTEIRDKLLSQIARIQGRARDIAFCDTLYALAVVALQNHYVCPILKEEGPMEIIAGRHPVVEALIGSDAYITNDCLLDGEDMRVMLITGPNMAGKSTYIRQVAIITLMAQIGSFVPADAATMGITDRIFTRVGASDDLATGQSTFMVEMTEVSNILKNATAKSLVILDEIGRGTSTFDGISIAWAVVEYLWDAETIGAKTLFATHYHELTELESLKPGIVNYSIGVKETAQGVVFLRKIKPGSADQSYGIEVAKLAGFPRKVTHRAQAILKHLEAGEDTYISDMAAAEAPPFADDQVNIFNMAVATEPEVSPEELEVLSDIRELDINEMTPMEAMVALHRLNKRLKE